MRFSAILTLSLSLFTTAITAIAFPSPASVSGDCGNCLSLVDSTNSCGYNIVDDDTTEPTAAQWKCLCNTDSFQSQYKSCLSCSVANEGMTSDDKDSAVKDVANNCALVTGGAGCLAVGPGKMVAAGAMAVGLGMYAL
ncbi:uncharacterized protein H6S33_007578 [Morchella sextelata]|uniref:uncharacterized protein n=1 Tax=Morchella sextelata TaxID=1174677 RepID=UPI001D05AF3E|nr:uncharacterized protein H6S33_007578 [Morchella sextelata]KAH0603919.1 hypothetical protein H6S33_007578 [Morchella sextelata]